jgi:hypothetical protein
MASLTASERIKLISAVATALENEGWPLIDLTLRQLKIPTSETWNGTTQSYVIEMVSDASDEKLLELGSHLGIDQTPRRSNIEPSFWLTNQLRLFVTHLAKHKKQAASLQTTLTSFHICSFIAHKDIEPAKKWQDEIELALSTADALVALLTPGFHESKWTDQEIGFALGRGIPILTVRLGEDPYGFLGREQAIPGDVKMEKLADSIFKVFVKNKLTRKRMAESVVYGLRSSHSYQEAKDNMTLVEQVQYWDEFLTSAIRAAIKENSQVSDAFGVPERVKQFLRQQSAKR